MSEAARTQSSPVAFPSPFPIASSVSHTPVVPSPFRSPLRETPRAAAALSDYLLLGPDRSLEKLVKHYGKKPSYVRQLQRWSSAFHWQERVRIFDAEEAEKRRKKNAEAIERMNEEQALIGRTHLLRAVAAMEPLLKTGEAPFPSLVSLFKYSAELERLARGAATSRMEGDLNVVVQPKEYLNISADECGSDP